MIYVKMKVSYDDSVVLNVGETDNLKLEIATPIESARHVPQYSGDYTITPTDSTQILETSYLMMTDNVTINPIPSNYGKITYNGSYLTVS